MKPLFKLPSGVRPSVLRRAPALLLLSLLLHPASAHASIFHGETLDKVANAMAWVVLAVVPAVAIAAFWLVHILPEKVAEKKQHPQAAAIQCLCLLSLFFGGLLWPLAWLWAYSKPVMYKLAYGTDRVPHGHDEEPAAPVPADAAEVARLRQQINELETKLAGKAAGEKGKA
jgi:CBS domain containing-hemolysin-like protein